MSECDGLCMCGVPEESIEHTHACTRCSHVETCMSPECPPASIDSQRRGVPMRCRLHQRIADVEAGRLADGPELAADLDARRSDGRRTHEK